MADIAWLTTQKHPKTSRGNGLSCYHQLEALHEVTNLQGVYVPR